MLKTHSHIQNTKNAIGLAIWIQEQLFGYVTFTSGANNYSLGGD